MYSGSITTMLVISGGPLVAMPSSLFNQLIEYFARRIILCIRLYTSGLGGFIASINGSNE